MADTPIDRESVKQALAELEDVVRCRCHEAYRGRGLHDPDCQCDSADAVATVRAALDAAEATSARIVSAYRINMMRHMSNYSHEAFDQHIAALQENPRKTAGERLIASAKEARAALQENPDG